MLKAAAKEKYEDTDTGRARQAAVADTLLTLIDKKKQNSQFAYEKFNFELRGDDIAAKDKTILKYLIAQRYNKVNHVRIDPADFDLQVGDNIDGATKELVLLFKKCGGNYNEDGLVTEPNDAPISSQTGPSNQNSGSSSSSATHSDSTSSSSSSQSSATSSSFNTNNGSSSYSAAQSNTSPSSLAAFLVDGQLAALLEPIAISA